MSRRPPKAPADAPGSDEPRMARFQLGTEEFAVVRLPDVARRPLQMLSDAEREVSLLLLAGLSNRAIAEERKTAIRTVANQIQSIYRKLDVNSRTELAARLAMTSGKARQPRN